MFKRMIFSSLLVLCCSTAFAGSRNGAEPNAVQTAPLAQYEYLGLTSQSVQSSGVGLLVKGANVQFVGLYAQHVFKKPLKHGFPRLYHTIDALLDGSRGRHQYIGIFKSESNQPVSGGINTFQAGAAYGYEVTRKTNLSLVFGGGLAVGNFGIKTADGKNWPVIPVPLARMNYHSDWLDAKFEFLTSPNLSFTLAPKARVRFVGDFRLDQFRDGRDIIFECSLAYRPFSEQSEQGDFAGLSVGIKNDNYGAFNLGHEDEKESLETHYYSLFASADATVLKISAGYAFGGRLLYREKEKQDLGEGFFVSVQGMLPL